MFIAGIEIFFGFIAGAILLALGVLILNACWRLAKLILKSLVEMFRWVVMRFNKNPLGILIILAVVVGCQAIDSHYQTDAGIAVGLEAAMVILLLVACQTTRDWYKKLNARLFPRSVGVSQQHP